MKIFILFNEKIQPSYYYDEYVKSPDIKFFLKQIINYYNFWQIHPPQKKKKLKLQ
jgi:hypothetical protein